MPIPSSTVPPCAKIKNITTKNIKKNSKTEGEVKTRGIIEVVDLFFP
jgi:hypothetical protein